MKLAIAMIIGIMTMAGLYVWPWILTNRRDRTIARLKASNRELLEVCKAVSEYSPTVYLLVPGWWTCPVCGARDRETDQLTHASTCPITLARDAIAKAEEE